MSLSNELAGDELANVPMYGTQGLEIVGLVLRLASVARSRLADTLRKIGISWGQYEVLLVVCNGDANTFASISRLLDRHRTSIKTTVAALERSGFVTRRPDPVATQRWLLESTESGRYAVERAGRALGHRADDAAATDDAREAIQLLRSMERSWA